MTCRYFTSYTCPLQNFVYQWHSGRGERHQSPPWKLNINHALSGMLTLWVGPVHVFVYFCQHNCFLATREVKVKLKVDNFDLGSHSKVEIQISIRSTSPSVRPSHFQKASRAFQPPFPNHELSVLAEHWMEKGHDSSALPAYRMRNPNSTLKCRGRTALRCQTFQLVQPCCVPLQIWQTPA